MRYFLLFIFLSLGIALPLSNYSHFSIVLVAIFTIYIIYVKKKKSIYYFLFFFTGFGITFLIDKSISTSKEISGIVIKASDNYFLLKTFKGTYYIYSKNCSFEMFDIVKIQGYGEEFSFSHYQESFDFKKYLNSYQCYSSYNLKSYEYIFKSPLRFNEYKRNILSLYSDSSKSIISPLIFSSSLSNLDSYYSIKNLNLTRLFSLSNFHISFIIEVIYKLVKKRSEKFALFIPVTFSFLFIFIKSFSLSVMRIFIVSIFTLINNIKKKTIFNYLEKLGLSGIVIVILNPCYVLSTSFFLIFSVLFLFDLSRNLLDTRNKKSKIRIFLIFFVLVLPFKMMWNYSFSIFGSILELILSPIMGIVFIIDLLSLLGEFTSPFLEMVNSSIYNIFNGVNYIDLSIYCGEINYYFILIYDILYLLFLYCKELYILPYKRIFTYSLISLFAASLLPEIFPRYEVHFIDVGQGDSTLIINNYQNILIDTGGLASTDLATSCLIPYFKRKKIYKLDCVLTTHNDYDHVGALESLVSHFNVSRVIRGGQEEKVQIGDLTISDLNKYRGDSEEENYISAVYNFQIKDTKFLIMGDAPKEIEKFIIRDNPLLRCDVLKLGHHGSSTSSCLEFLETVEPSLAIISCGYNNKYGHPAKSVIENLDKCNISYIRTDIVGTYVYNLRI